MPEEVSHCFQHHSPSIEGGETKDVTTIITFKKGRDAWLLLLIHRYKTCGYVQKIKSVKLMTSSFTSK